MIGDRLKTEDLYRMGFNYIYPVHNDNEVYMNNLHVIMARQDPQGVYYNVRAQVPRRNPKPQQTRIPFPEAVKEYIKNGNTNY